MRIFDFVKKENIFLQKDLKSKKEIFEFLSEKFSHIAEFDKSEILKSMIDRENALSTGIGKGIAIPHAFLDDLDGLHVAIITLKNPIDFNSVDKQPVSIIFSIISNNLHNNTYLSVISSLLSLFQFDEKRVEFCSYKRVEDAYDFILPG